MGKLIVLMYIAIVLGCFIDSCLFFHSIGKAFTKETGKTFYLCKLYSYAPPCFIVSCIPFVNILLFATIAFNYNEIYEKTFDLFVEYMKEEEKEQQK